MPLKSCKGTHWLANVKNCYQGLARRTPLAHWEPNGTATNPGCEANVKKCELLLRSRDKVDTGPDWQTNVKNGHQAVERQTHSSRFGAKRRRVLFRSCYKKVDTVAHTGRGMSKKGYQVAQTGDTCQVCIRAARKRSPLRDKSTEWLLRRCQKAETLAQASRQM